MVEPSVAAPVDLLATRDAQTLDPVASLESRLHIFEARLYHGLLVARVVLPTATFAVLASAAVSGQEPGGAALVWGALSIWTGATTPVIGRAWNG